MSDADELLRDVIEKFDGNSNNPYWSEQFNQAVRVARAYLNEKQLQYGKTFADLANEAAQVVQPTEPPDDYREFDPDERTLLDYMNGTPALVSLLYDLDLMPEQTFRNEAMRAKTFCIIDHWKTDRDAAHQPTEPVAWDRTLRDIADHADLSVSDQELLHRAADACAAPAVQPPDHTKRWNIEESNEGEIRVCQGQHPSGEPCEWQYYVPKSAAVQPIPRDTTRLDWTERTNPIIFHKTSDAAEWTVVVAPHDQRDEYSGPALRSAIDAAMDAFTKSTEKK